MENGGGRGKRPCPTTPPTATHAAEEDDQEEAVEKFYALLENIRAMRDLIRTNDSYKRQKTEATPPPWRPTFALEDFREREEPCATAESALDPSKEEGRRKGKEKREVVGEEDDSAVDLSLSL